MHRILKIIVGLVLLVLAAAFTLFLVVIVFPIARDTLAHELHRKYMEFELTRLRHPHSSTFVSSRSTVGLYSGNSNHCDYFAGQLRQFSGDQQAIADFYQGQDVSVLFVENGTIGFEDYLNQPKDWGVTPEKLLGGYYIVYQTDYFHSPGYDFRCH